ncbi:hypothetical protein CVM73_17335 [Bradyrhizobium forestalis]|uniref:Uncharacterized protein n=1 Tax=Bradyrhizobium forestalis TaxID=1419263 RepID=A0A2M8R7M3_9BRAD|nr:hypothetical protein CVM73_17335 [Bradyrhizobium forestalis]
MPRLDRGIQYAAAHRLNRCRLGILDRPVKPGDDSSRVDGACAASLLATTPTSSPPAPSPRPTPGIA